MDTSVISNIVNEYESLPYDDKLYVFELFQKQLIEAKRTEIRLRADDAIHNLENSFVKKGSFSDLLTDLGND
ncbi:MAG: hypothetical protein A2015_02385 [Spirochaetes bacterium GWF1_31_7]|nr:MAG: hypothetical protein A2Y30_06235 [Spirochaetes bacterium GWE1_32_154]OHD50761.1 MAG: hypothetical protein A2015_02385 [Spirochaetes bacterium GWF1_31_7]OHD51960.1 MAG: hypothetical protein A2Y29_07160 [Spirochaetes bacterium GWE2_31_10]OHD78614.1 MAG: hypothetical protein A2355_05080 [Spirochaetes bacterium RIFOXYB1_FULL_32_8]HBD95100.1 hypothetical protein [Spirochaetia bacterium]